MKKTLIVVFAATLLCGCTAMPPLNFSVPNVTESPQKIEAELRSVVVTIAQPEEQTGPMPADTEREVPAIWQTSLTDALNRAAIFQDDAHLKVNLSVKILQANLPAFGMSMTTTVEANYELLDRKTGRPILSQRIKSEGVVPAGYAFAGVVRARESMNRAVKNNIAQFIEVLQKSRISVAR